MRRRESFCQRLKFLCNMSRSRSGHRAARSSPPLALHRSLDQHKSRQQAAEVIAELHGRFLHKLLEGITWHTSSAAALGSQCFEDQTLPLSRSNVVSAIVTSVSGYAQERDRQLSRSNSALTEGFSGRSMSTLSSDHESNVS